MGTSTSMKKEGMDENLTEKSQTIRVYKVSYERILEKEINKVF